MNCPKHEDIDLDHVFGDFPTGVVAPDGGKEIRAESGLYCPRCNVTYDPSDLEDDESAVCDPDHLNPAKGGNRASDDYW